MRFRRIRFFGIILFLATFSLVIGQLGDAQPQNKNQEQSWQSILYERGVKYEDFACKSEDSAIVASFFKEHPILNRIFPICHNDCPVIRCRPVIPFPPLAKAAKVSGTVSVHVLVDEQGRSIYARVLDGHPLLWAAARKGACETQFNLYPDHKRQGVMHFNIDDSGYLGVPYAANQVR